MSTFISGVATTLAVIAGLFFLRFWRRTADSFFAMFALAFFLLGAERCALVATHSETDPENFIYLIRVVAFGLILAAIGKKNRKSAGRAA